MLRGEKSYMNMKIMKYIGLGLLPLVCSCGGRDRQVEEALSLSGNNRNDLEALKSINFTVEAGEYIAIMGESGSGKTTLLNILALLDRPTSGKVILRGKDLQEIRDSQMAKFRRENFGFVFQDFNLLDNFTVKENILLPLVLSDEKISVMEEKLWKTILAAQTKMRYNKSIKSLR